MMLVSKAAIFQSSRYKPSFVDIIPSVCYYDVSGMAIIASLAETLFCRKFSSFIPHNSRMISLRRNDHER